MNKGYNYAHMMLKDPTSTIPIIINAVEKND